MNTIRASLVVALLSPCTLALGQTPQGGSYRINTTVESDQEAHGLAVGADGRLVAAWIDESPVGADEVKVQRFLPDGTPVGPEMQADQTSIDNPDKTAVAVAADDSFLVVWW